MKNLFNIDAELYEVYNEIENNGGEMTPELEAALEISEAERLTKGEGYVYVIKQLKSQAEMIKAEAKRLQELAKRYENSADKLADTLLQSVVAHGQIKTAFVTISSRKSKSVSITDESLLGAEFLRIKTEPNKTAIKEALESGQEVQGALIVENYSLNIR
jgi:predicted double-glycine peptidase